MWYVVTNTQDLLGWPSQITLSICNINKNVIRNQEKRRVESYDVRPAINFEARCLLLFSLAYHDIRGEGEGDKTYCHNDVEIAKYSIDYLTPGHYGHYELPRVL